MGGATTARACASHKLGGYPPLSSANFTPPVHLPPIRPPQQVDTPSPLQKRAVLLNEASEHRAIRVVQPRQSRALDQLGTLLASARDRDVAIASNEPVGPFLKLKRVVECWFTAHERLLQLRMLMLPACAPPHRQPLSKLIEEAARLARVGDRAAEEGGELRRQRPAQRRRARRGAQRRRRRARRWQRRRRV